MRHIEALRRKIQEIEERHAHREEELQAIIRNKNQSANTAMEQENARWRTLLDAKNREIERFRTELDSILQVLKELHKQGVYLPSVVGGAVGGWGGVGSSRGSGSASSSARGSAR